MFLLAVCHASLALLAFNFRMGVYDNVLKAGDKWSAAQLGKLALSKQMSAVVSRMGDVIADDSVAQLLYNERWGWLPNPRYTYGHFYSLVIL